MKEVIKQNSKEVVKEGFSSGEKLAHISTNATAASSKKPFSYWLKKNSYYHTRVQDFYTFIVPRQATALILNCRNGYLFDAIKPVFGVGVDHDAQERAQAQNKFPEFKFHSYLNEIDSQHAFDYILLPLSTMEADDIQEQLEALKKFSHDGTRIVVDTYSHLWEPVLWLLQKMGLRRPTMFKHWISHKDMMNFLHLAGYEPISAGRHTLLPFYIPLISAFCNKILVHVPLISHLCLHQWIIARPQPQPKKTQDFSVSVIIPCKNERGNIQAAVERTPKMGAYTELIFIDGHSRDNTFEEMQRVAREYPEKNIRVLVQDGKGKGDAVRKGFAHATGDVLMILDADLTMPPEELPKFFNALISSKGEFINGSRLVYGMENEAMRFLNLLANFFFGTLFSWLLNQKVKDTLCGTKVLYKKDYEAIVRNRAFFGDFDPFGDFDLLFGAAKLNLKIIDMPIHYKNRTYGTTQIRRFYHGWILLGMSLLALRKLKIR